MFGVRSLFRGVKNISIRDLRYSIPLDEITNKLVIYGSKITNIINIRPRESKGLLYLLFVHLSCKTTIEKYLNSYSYKMQKLKLNYKSQKQNNTLQDIKILEIGALRDLLQEINYLWKARKYHDIKICTNLRVPFNLYTTQRYT